MADPQALYVVAAVVASGLAVWVAIVLLRSPRAGRPPLASTARPDAPPANVPASPSAPTTATGRSDRPKLDSHAEIRDEPGAKTTRRARAGGDEGDGAER